jgi:NADPH:quinone reductase-like Zn-dependent oxidoreductase
VGRFVIRLGRARGSRTVNVVRRETLFAELEALGADVCVVDGPDLAERVQRATGGASIRLGLDAVSGRATARISACVGEGGVVCHYGSMSGEDPIMPRGKLISEGQSLVGFILGRALASRSRAQVRAIYAELGEQVRAGLLTAPVERTYPIEEIQAAVAHAERGERAGKILVTPNSPIT